MGLPIFHIPTMHRHIGHFLPPDRKRCAEATPQRSYPFDEEGKPMATTHRPPTGNQRTAAVISLGHDFRHLRHGYAQSVLSRSKWQIGSDWIRLDQIGSEWQWMLVSLALIRSDLPRHVFHHIGADLGGLKNKAPGDSEASCMHLYASCSIVIIFFVHILLSLG